MRHISHFDSESPEKVAKRQCVEPRGRNLVDLANLLGGKVEAASCRVPDSKLASRKAAKHHPEFRILRGCLKG